MRDSIGLAVLAALLALALVWAEPRPIDDLFIGLAGGRDVVEGKLGSPDDWSFSTDGRVWINQNWGSHLLFYVVHQLGGTAGLFTLKAALLALCALFVGLAARERGVDWPLALVVAGATIAAGRSYIDLRPNLVNLAFTGAALWLLTRSAAKPSSVFWLVPLIAAWANAHGGFILGLGLLGAWTLALMVVDRRQARISAGSLVVCVVVAGLASPFGGENLTHAVVVASSPAWRSVAEWVPLFTSEVTEFGSRWEVCAAAVLLAGLVSLRVLTGHHRQYVSPPGSQARRALPIFSVLVAIATMAMTLRARRFAPIALMALAPMIATEAASWSRRLPLASILSMALIVGVAVAAPPVLRRYDAENPVFRGTSQFGRMVDEPTFPVAAAEFLRANDIGGLAYAAWEWEGYLRWRRVPVKVLVGGRAQQVYDESALRVHQGLRTGGLQARAIFEQQDVGLVIVPLTGEYATIVNGLVYDEGSRWVYVYCDGRHGVLLDTADPTHAGTVAQAASGDLEYANPAIALASRMMYLASPATDAPMDAVWTAAENAARAAPTPLAYAVLGDLALTERSKLPMLRTYLDHEQERLSKALLDGADRFAIAQARLAAARIAFAIAAPATKSVTSAALAVRTSEMRELLEVWAYGWDPEIF